ncbi:hypothetical protein [Ammoniphilus sp. 3BR4]|uniref:hypothetical protein n=1 Tax=Ammoniphilus sp. 3BR4 TaxID=3158265 RepID=UPI003467C0AB
MLLYKLVNESSKIDDYRQDMYKLAGYNSMSEPEYQKIRIKLDNIIDMCKQISTLRQHYKKESL